MVETIKNLLFLLLGWTLGLISSLIIELVRRNQIKVDFMCGVLTEIDSLRFKLAFSAFGFHSYLGPIEDDFLGWFRLITERYNGPEKESALLEEIQKKAMMSPRERYLYYRQRHKPNRFTRPSKYSLPFIDIGMSKMALCPNDFQLRVLRVREQLNFYNDKVQFVLDQLNLTFNPAITERIERTVLENLNESLKRLISRAHSIVDDINWLEEKYGMRYRKKAKFSSA